MVLKLSNYAAGWLRIEVTGGFPERFLNICTQNGVGLWDIRRIDENRLHVSARSKSFALIAALARKCMCGLHILRKAGLWFRLRPLRTRTVLVAGLTALAAGLFLLSQCVWTVRVQPTERVRRSEILAALEELGIKSGAWASSIDPVAVKTELLLRFDGLTWIAVNIKGSSVEVSLREREEVPAAYPRDLPCDVVAARDGLIRKMTVTAGAALTGVGQTVLAGDVLVRGHLTSENPEAEDRFVHADADILAETWYNIPAFTPVTKYIKRYTGKKTVKYALVVAGRRMNLYFNGGIAYADYDKIISVTAPETEGGFALPVSLVRETYLEYIAVPTAKTREELQKQLRFTLHRTLKDILGEQGSILSEDYIFSISDVSAAARLKSGCEQQIARQVAIEN